MNKIHIKLIAMVVTLLLLVCVVGASSYAWMVLSKSPAVSGMQVAIGGGNTVLIAPDIVEVAEDGTVCHYPGKFSDKMNFSQQEAYSYLQQLGNLNPVSTTNGVDWILPAYYDSDDQEVLQGFVPNGAIKNVEDFYVDSELIYANVSATDTDSIEKGHYVYLDFWVVSPANSYKLRVSTGVEELDGGSFVVDLPKPVSTTQGYTLEQPEGSSASAVRVGFLANDLTLMDGAMSQYRKSRYFDQRFSALRGMYQEPDTGTAYLDANRFTIYEPNGDNHPAHPQLDGYYVETKPLALENGRIVEKERNQNLTVQKTSMWLIPAGSHVSALEQRFQTALYSGSWNDLTSQEMADRFYGNYLQGQIAPYVRKAGFVQKTSNLYAQLNAEKVPLQDATVGATNAGATDDAVIIELERNIPQRIRMFIWLEGQDVDCVEQIAAAAFAVNIELACGDE